MTMRVSCRCGRAVVLTGTPPSRSVRCPQCQALVDTGRNPKQDPELMPGDPPPAAQDPSRDPSINNLPRATPLLPSRLAEPPESSPPLPPPVSTTVNVGVEYSQADRKVAYFLGACISLVAFIGIVPLLVEWFDPQGPEAMPRWACLLLVVAALKWAYSLYLVQVIDWSSLWVVALFALLVSAAYAALVGIRLLAQDVHPIIRTLQLDTNRYTPSQEAGWCFIMLLLTGLLSYSCGRTASRWKSSGEYRISNKGTRNDEC